MTASMGRRVYLPTSIFQGVLFGTKGWCIGTPYHPFSTLWKIQVYMIFFVLNGFHVGKNTPFVHGSVLGKGET